MSLTTPVPLYPTCVELKEFKFESYPQLKGFLAGGEPWWSVHWRWGQEFLLYIGRNKSEHTFSRFRNETERFLLWAFLIRDLDVLVENSALRTVI